MTHSWSKIHKHLLFAALAALLAIGLAYAAAYVNIRIIVAVIIGILLLGIIAKQPLFGMYLLLFFLPFERLGSVDIAGTTIRISQVIAILTICVWILRGLWLQKFKLRTNPIIWPVLIFLAVNILGLVNTPNISRSLTVLAFTIFTIVIALAVPNILRHKNQLTTGIKVLLASMVVVGLFGIFQFVGDLIGLPTSITGLRPQYTKEILGFPRVQSTALEPLYFANYLLIPLSVAIALFLSKASRVRPILLLSIIALGGLNLVLTVSRGGYIAFAVVIALLVVRYWREVLKPRVIISTLAVSVMIAFTAFRFFGAGEQLTSFTQHVGNIFGGASYVERVETFDIAHRIWLEHPLIGIGPGGFGPYASFHPLITPNDGYKIVNNVYIELLAETGIIGLATYILLVVIILLRSIKALRKGKDPLVQAILFGLFSAFIGVLVQYNTFSVLYILHIWTLIGLIVATQNILLQPPQDAETSTKK